jgi:hypothetical protein
VQINGVRDRLRVLLVSGEPYPGERTWRNLLKSDSAVDLVHFTILRPPDKQDFVPVFELSVIAVPDAGALYGEGRRVRPDHLRPLQAPGHPAQPLFREHRALRPRGRRAVDRVGRGDRGGRQPRALAAERGAAGAADLARAGGRVPSAGERDRASATR